MNATDIKNFDIIEKLVSNHFGLSQKSMERFSEELRNKTVDEKYKSMLNGTEDLRIRFPLDRTKIEFFDKGWQDFRKAFPDFCRETDIKYSSYRKNRIEINKNVYKLEKALIIFYKKESNYYYNLVNGNERNRIFPLEFVNMSKEEILCVIIREFLYLCGLIKFPNINNATLVLSLNFADWFLCSTGEKWTSCLNMESDYRGCYWAGLPGTIVDKNRCMIYLTDGVEKEYREIIVDRTISRTWALLDTENVIGLVRNLPGEMPIELYRDFFGPEVYFIKDKRNFVAKHSIDLMFHEDESSCFIYQDRTWFQNTRTKNKKYIKHFGSDTGGMFSYKKESDTINEDLIFSYTKGLRGLIQDEERITNVKVPSCYNCGKILGSNIYEIEGESYCEDCYYDNVFTCEYCGLEISKNIERPTITYDGYAVCSKCIGYISKCESCNNDFLEMQLYLIDGEKICRKCMYANGYEFCYGCDKIFKMGESNIPHYCNDCRTSSFDNVVKHCYNTETY